MAKVICFSSQKGGVGKTTSTHNVGVILAQRKFKTLLIDLDPSGNLTKAVGYNRTDFEDNANACDLFEKGKQVQIFNTNVANLFIIPATVELGLYRDKLVLAPAGEVYLKRALKNFKDMFDYILIDTPPALDQLVINAHVAADYLIIPTDSSEMSTTNMEDSIAFLNTCLDEELNSELKYLGSIITQFRIADTDQIELVKSLKDTNIVLGVIKLSKDATVGLKQGKSAVEVRPTGDVASGYRAIANAIMNKIREVEANVER